MSWQGQQSCVPLHLMGDKEARYTPRGIGRQHATAKEDRFRNAQWAALYVAMRGWIGAWMESSE